MLQTSTIQVQSAVPEQTMKITDMMFSGGTGGTLVMVVLILCSILTVFIFVERYLSIRKASKVDKNLLAQVKKHILSGDINNAKLVAENVDSPYARLMYKGITRIGKPLADINGAIENAGKLETFSLEKNLGTLATISGAAPMIGFLGTVIGMVIAFFNMAKSGGQINVEMLSQGIYTAMMTTVAGLIVGITAYVAYNFLVLRVDRVVYKMESTATDFLDLLNEPS